MLGLSVEFSKLINFVTSAIRGISKPYDVTWKELNDCALRLSAAELMHEPQGISRHGCCVHGIGSGTGIGIGKAQKAQYVERFYQALADVKLR